MAEELNDANAAGSVIPASEVTPLPGQPEPNSPESQGAKQGDEQKTVPLAALHEERDRRQSLQAELEALRQIAGNQVLFDVNGRPVGPTPQNENQSVDSDAFQKQLDKAWEEDPRKAVEMTIGSALQWRDDIDNQVDAQERDVESRHQDFNEYRNDVRKYIRTLPMNQRANPGIAEMAYFVVKGQKSGNVYTKAQADILEKIRKGEQVSGLMPGAGSTPVLPKGVELSSDQLKVAEAMGLTPDQYKSAIVVKK